MNYEEWEQGDLIKELKLRDKYQARVIKAISGADNLQELYNQVLDIYDGAI